MATVTFDKHNYIRLLKAGGFTEAQAEAAGEALDIALRDSVATKMDIEIAVIRLEGKIDQKVADLLKWGVTLMLGQAALIAALVKLL